jgi:hypothetical protein
MKYTYAYKTPDGTRHEASIEAPSRDVAFAVLRSQGIRPIKVVAADGSKENGEERQYGSVKIWKWAIVAVLVFFAAFVFFVANKQPAPEFQADQTRRYPIGDAAIIEKGILTGWSDVFEHEGDRFLASFAVPGVKAAQRNTTVDEIKSALGRSVSIANDDGLEARQIKAMVEGMKAEARAYVAAGGSVVEYGKRLTERQDAEIAIYERTKVDLERAKETMRGNALINYWESQNDKLRNLGIRPLTLESLE